MSCVEKVKEALSGITADTQDSVAAANLMALLPEDARSEQARGIIVQLVAARKSWLHHDDCYQRASTTISVIEADPEDERATYLRSYESDADDAAESREGAAEAIKVHLARLAELLGEEPPDGKLGPDEMDNNFSLQAPLTDYYLGPRPEGCALPAVLLVSLLTTTPLLIILR